MKTPEKITVNLRNFSRNYPRTQWTSFTVPLTPDVRKGNFFSLKNGSKTYYAVGGQILGEQGRELHALVDFQAGEFIKGLQLIGEDTTVPFPYAESSWVLDNLEAVIPWPVILKPAAFDTEEPDPGQGPLDKEIPGRPDLVEVRPDKIKALAEAKLVEQNAARRVYHLRQRIKGTILVWDCYLYIYNQQDLVEWDWTLTAGVGSDAKREDFEGLYIEAGEIVAVEYAKRLGVGTVFLDPADGRWKIPLMGRDYIGYSQQVAYMGYTLCLPDREMKDYIDGSPRNLLNVIVQNPTRVNSLLAAMEGPAIGCLGAGEWDFNFLSLRRIPNPDRSAKDRERLRAIYGTDDLMTIAEIDLERFEASLNYSGNYWDSRPEGLKQNAGTTGDQEDFGAVKGTFTLCTGNPGWIWSVFLEGITSHLRPGHYREADGSPVMYKDHPDWATWSQLTDHRLGSDFLGYTARNSAGWLDFDHRGGWGGADDQHFSHRNEAAAYALRPRYWMKQLIEDRIQVFGAGHPPKDTTLGRRWGAPRAIGRTMHTLSDDYILTGNSDSSEIVKGRFEFALKNWFGSQVSGPVKVLGTVTDLRALRTPPREGAPYGDPVRCWVVWEHGLATHGLKAVENVFQLELAAKINYEICRTVVAYGHYTDFNGENVCSHVAYLEDGQPLAPELYIKANENQSGGLFSPGGSFWDWITPCTLNFIDYMERNSTVNVDPTTSPGESIELSKKAYRIIDKVLNQQANSPIRKAEWLAVSLDETI
jgi:hypothetical protein